MCSESTEEIRKRTLRSSGMFERASHVLPQGVTYSIRFFDPYPFYASRGQGSRIYDIDENEYIDFWLGHTSLILGHAHPEIIEAVRWQVERGSHFGTPHEAEVILAETIADALPSVEMVRFTNSGTEACMYAARLCRAYTKKSKLAKFMGGWHGGYDALHAAIKPPFEETQSAGLPPYVLEDVVLLSFNDLEETEKTLRKHSEEVAAVIIEPVMGVGGALPAEREFLKGLRELCSNLDILLVFDEVITGFRLGYDGGQGFYGVYPDVTILGKIIGGGFPMGAFGARSELMRLIDSRGRMPQETSFHGGTFTGNPVSCMAGIAALRVLKRQGIYEHMNGLGEDARTMLYDAFTAVGLDVQVIGAGSLFGTHFMDRPVRSAEDTFSADRELLRKYHTYLVSRGIFILPTHAAALCQAHTREDVKELASATEDFARLVARGDVEQLPEH